MYQIIADHKSIPTLQRVCYGKLPTLERAMEVLRITWGDKWGMTNWRITRDGKVVWKQ